MHGHHLIVRLGEGAAREALKEPHVRPFDLTGRPMKGWAMVGRATLSGEALDRWLARARAFAETLRPKAKK